MNIQALALAFLAFTAIGGVAWVFLYPLLSGQRKAENRRASGASPEPVARNVDKTQRSRREQVEGSLKDLDARRQKDKKVSLSVRLTQAGLDWTPRKFVTISAALGLVTFALVFMPSLKPADSTGTAPVMVDPESPGSTVELGLGRSLVIDLRRNVSSVRSSEPTIANASVRSAQQSFVTSATEGRASIVALDNTVKPMTTYDFFLKAEVGLHGLLGARCSGCLRRGRTVAIGMVIAVP